MTKTYDKMEEKFMKAKLMALMLAVGLGVTGVAVTAQAAERESACSHLTEVRISEFDHADFCNPEGHYSTYNITIKCGDCGYVKREYTEYKFEWHDYESIFLDNGRVKLECTYCHDSYYQF